VSSARSAGPSHLVRAVQERAASRPLRRRHSAEVWRALLVQQVAEQRGVRADGRAPSGAPREALPGGFQLLCIGAIPLIHIKFSFFPNRRAVRGLQPTAAKKTSWVRGLHSTFRLNSGPQVNQMETSVLPRKYPVIQGISGNQSSIDFETLLQVMVSMTPSDTQR